jgi:RimK family alpha-L-glutamate ligase
MLGISPLVAVVAWHAEDTNASLVAAWRSLGVQARLLVPPDVRALLGPDDVALVRLDVLRTLDGVERGLSDIDLLERRGVRVLNTSRALLAAHDKLETADRLARAGIPHPWTLHVTSIADLCALDLPFVIKPRFGSWGRDVMLCRSTEDRDACVATLRARRWFKRRGALVQELIPPRLHDLRLLIAHGEVVGAAERRARPGEWRTNISLGGTLAPGRPSREACALGAAAAEAIGADFVGVDLLPTPDGHVVLELNGAADFDQRYSLPGRDVYADAARVLGLVAEAVAAGAA